MEQEQVDGEVLPVWWCPSQSATARCLLLCEQVYCVEATTIPSYHKSCLFSCTERSVTSEDLIVDLLIRCLTLWQDLAVGDSPRIEERYQYDLDFWLWLAYIHPPRWLPLNSGDCFPGHTQRTMSHPQW